MSQFQNQFSNRFTNELVQAYKELEQRYHELVQENCRITAQDRDMSDTLTSTRLPLS